MRSVSNSMSSSCNIEGDNNGLKRGPWTAEEDNLLIHSIALHGDGRWNLLAVRSGLRRTGKSCRLRWLNYLKPDVKRGNLSPQEQLLILELHSRWGNRWSKIAQQLPGRTDNEIKNYWRTRVQKQANLLKMDASSPKFQDLIRKFWIPRLLQQIKEPSSFTQLSEPKDPVPDLKKSHHELKPDPSPYQHFNGPCISSSESVDVSSGSDPFSDVPSWNHGGGYDMKSHFDAAADFDWMADESDGGGFWNFDNLWQF